MWARPLGTLESRRWVEGYERVAERAQKLPGTPWSMSLMSLTGTIEPPLTGI
jgi:hypothetical protein